MVARPLRLYVVGAALSTLAFNNPSNQLAIATGLVALLGTGNAEAQEHVTMLMLSLMVDPDNRLAIAKAGAVKRLVKQLKQMISLKAEELAAAALSYLTGDFTDASDDNIRDIKAEGGIEPMSADPRVAFGGATGNGLPCLARSVAAS